MLSTACEVAAQAIICGVLGFRASVEVTEHPRTREARLAELGLSEAYLRLKRVEVEVSTLASTVPSVKGLYVVRALTAGWLLPTSSSS
jgi:hypothetical protein